MAKHSPITPAIPADPKHMAQDIRKGLSFEQRMRLIIELISQEQDIDGCDIVEPLNEAEDSIGVALNRYEERGGPVDALTVQKTMQGAIYRAVHDATTASSYPGSVA